MGTSQRQHQRNTRRSHDCLSARAHAYSKIAAVRAGECGGRDSSPGRGCCTPRSAAARGAGSGRCWLAGRPLAGWTACLPCWRSDSSPARLLVGQLHFSLGWLGLACPTSGRAAQRRRLTARPSGWADAVSRGGNGGCEQRRTPDGSRRVEREKRQAEQSAGGQASRRAHQQCAQSSRPWWHREGGGRGTKGGGRGAVRGAWCVCVVMSGRLGRGRAAPCVGPR